MNTTGTKSPAVDWLLDSTWGEAQTVIWWRMPKAAPGPQSITPTLATGGWYEGEQAWKL